MTARSRPAHARHIAAQAAEVPYATVTWRSGAFIAALFVVSISSLSSEIALTRILSLLFQYHYAFLSLSLAILGLGLGAVLGYWARSRSNSDADMSLALLALSLAFPLVATFLAWYPSTASVLPQAAAALLPYLAIGAFGALAFSSAAAHSGFLYGADLAGGAVGVAAALGLLSVLDPFSVLLALGAVGALAALGLALLSQRRPLGAAALVSVLLSGGLLAINLLYAPIAYAPARLSGVPRDKTMLGILRDPGQSARIVYTTWDPFARVDVVQTADPDVQYVFTDGGAGSTMYRLDGDLARWASLRDTLEYIPFTVGSADQTLVLGAGAGKDVLMALLGGAGTVTAVEVNPAMVKATRQFADYNGAILDYPQVSLAVEDGRAFVERSSERYDLIYIDLAYTQAATPASQSLVENYIFTRQAFRAYVAHLRPGGRLAIVSHNALEGSRAAITGLQALADGGEPLPEALGHLALLMLPAQDPTERKSVMVLSKTPLAEQEIRDLAAASGRLGLQPLYLPGVFEAPFAPLLRGTTMEDFLAADPGYELWPTDDDRPFFFKLDPGLPRPVGQALWAAGALALLLLGVGLWQRRVLHRGERRLLGPIGVALTGAGFMLVEVPLIQRFQLLLGHPMLSLALVLGTLLLAGGAGSMLSQRWPTRQLRRRVGVVAIAIVAIGLIYYPALPKLTAQLIGASLPWRLLAIVGLTALIGIPMGMPFPSMLRLSGARHPSGIPMLWGINGAFSALGAVLAMAVAITWGFGGAMIAGLAHYLALGALAWPWWRA
jgi:predicted membrane-bound spermidine synthase